MQSKKNNVIKIVFPVVSLVAVLATAILYVVVMKSGGAVEIRTDTSADIAVLDPEENRVSRVVAAEFDTTGLKVELDAKTYLVVVKKASHETIKKEVKVNRGKTTKVECNLKPMLGSMDITSAPTGAKVTIDDIEHGVTPVTVDNLLAKRHVVVVEKPFYGPHTMTVQVEQGGTVQANVELKQFEGTWRTKYTRPGYEPKDLPMEFTITKNMDGYDVNAIIIEPPTLRGNPTKRKRYIARIRPVVSNHDIEFTIREAVTSGGRPDRFEFTGKISSDALSISGTFHRKYHDSQKGRYILSFSWDGTLQRDQ